MLVQTHARTKGMGGGIGSPIYRHRSRIILALQIVESPLLDTLLVRSGLTHDRLFHPLEALPARSHSWSDPMDFTGL